MPPLPGWLWTPYSPCLCLHRVSEKPEYPVPKSLGQSQTHTQILNKYSYYQLQRFPWDWQPATCWGILVTSLLTGAVGKLGWWTLKEMRGLVLKEHRRYTLMERCYQLMCQVQVEGCKLCHLQGTVRHCTGQVCAVHLSSVYMWWHILNHTGIIFFSTKKYAFSNYLKTCSARFSHIW